MISIPWTEAQIEVLNAFQGLGVIHPFTCGYREDHYAVNPGILVATTTGWECPYKHCDYMQFWAHEFMFNPHWVDCSFKCYMRGHTNV